MIRLTGAAFGYGRRTVLDHLDLAIQRGEVVGIVGPNGGGKTTLFRGILGLIAPRRGTIERHSARVGYVPQREALDALYPITVEEVVQMGAYGRLRGWRRLAPADRALARECLERVELSAKRSELFASLSGGQRQRVLIARALMVRPELLLLDEPTSGVDVEAAQRILALLERMNREEGTTILLVSHDLALVRAVAGRILWVDQGTIRVHATGDLERLDRTGLLALGRPPRLGGEA